MKINVNSNDGITVLNMFMLAYDGEEEQQENNQEQNQEQNNQEQENKNNNKDNKDNKTRLFTQDELNKFMAEDRKKNQRNREDLLKQLNDIKENATLTTKQKEELEGRIEQLQNETLSAQELARKDREKLQKDWEKEKNNILKERDYWKNHYQSEKIERELLDAALTHKAINPNQLANMLIPKSKLVELLKDGKPTGIWETRVTLHDKGEDGQTVTLELPATEAIKRMADMAEHWNLFNSGASGGLGGFNVTGSNGSLRNSRPPKDPVEYAKWRKVNIGK